MTKTANKTALVLRTCAADGTSYNDFRWPLKVGSIVKAPDWKPTKECGNGLHGLLHGAGAGSLLNWSPDAKWMVLEIKLADAIMLGGKCKFPQAKILFVGDRKAATDFMLPLVPNGSNVVGAFVTVGDGQIATAGYSGTATAGNSGTATAGNRGTATAGDYGTATAGDYGTATAGNSGEIRIRWYDYAKDRYRTVGGYIGENGLKANTKYRLNDKHEFVQAD